MPIRKGALFRRRPLVSTEAAPDHAIVLTRPGFRPGKVPSNLQTQYLFSAMRCAEPTIVDRVDAMWVHGRGHDARQKILAEKHVVIAGCGSVGGPIAQQLAMAGVGRLTLVDPELLSWSNIGRHPLGSKFVGLPKSTALSGCYRKICRTLESTVSWGRSKTFSRAGQIVEQI